ncbi:MULTISPECIES: hypothetical protein [Nostoc]|uniref:Transposase n=1 Tax=Nostoc paludosum FACHB-159 TaxID=2692908 RepID=A0ABR8KB59_9NOSO|nr:MULTISPECIES: hypothetical protein [Nostoc]MBD2679773.1 hypothetical protein [Nostoc sp. FACHB-857]MBD2736021.1 hypothetical protein [Nostoc paludosum FACHB-159]
MLFKARSHNSYTSTVFIKSIAYAVVEALLRSHSSNHDLFSVQQLMYCKSIGLPLL